MRRVACFLVVLIAPPALASAPEVSHSAAPANTSQPDAPLSTPPTRAMTFEPDAPLAAPAAPAVGPWPRRELPVGTWDVVATGALAVGVVTVQFGVPQPSAPKWGSTGFDDWVRGGLRISSEGGRTAAATASDVLVFSLTALPFLNAFLVAGAEHGRMDVAWKLAVLDAETLLTATFAALSLQKVTARGRPFLHECESNPTLAECSIGTRNASFPSAHTTVAFAAVALECFHHGYLDTSHTGWAAAACPVTVAAATITGVLRIASDRHWATDVIAGAVLGGTLGYAIPALHLVVGDTETAVLTPSISPSYLGLTLAGRF